MLLVMILLTRQHFFQVELLSYSYCIQNDSYAHSDIVYYSVLTFTIHSDNWRNILQEKSGNHFQGKSQ